MFYKSRCMKKKVVYLITESDQNDKYCILLISYLDINLLKYIYKLLNIITNIEVTHT